MTCSIQARREGCQESVLVKFDPWVPLNAVNQV
jgi:hypothetical protein